MKENLTGPETGSCQWELVANLKVVVDGNVVDVVHKAVVVEGNVVDLVNRDVVNKNVVVDGVVVADGRGEGQYD